MGADCAVAAGWIWLDAELVRETGHSFFGKAIASVEAGRAAGYINTRSRMPA